MEDWKLRVIEEKNALDSRIGRLDAFLETGTFRSIPFIDQVQMRGQLEVMEEYSRILGMRIDRFKEPK